MTIPPDSAGRNDTGRTPSKPWRVDPTRGVGWGYYFRSQPTAYGKVQALTAKGETATVYHWENGDWRLCERVEPVPDEPPKETGQ